MTFKKQKPAIPPMLTLLTPNLMSFVWLASFVCLQKGRISLQSSSYPSCHWNKQTKKYLRIKQGTTVITNIFDYYYPWLNLNILLCFYKNFLGWAGGKGCELHIFLLGTTSFLKKERSYSYSVFILTECKSHTISTQYVKY